MLTLIGAVWVCGTAGLQIGTDVSVPSPIEVRSPKKSEPTPAVVTVVKPSRAAPTPSGESLALKPPAANKASHRLLPKKKPVVPLRTGTIRGRIVFDGTPPEHELMIGGLPKVDPAVCGQIEHYYENMLVNPLNNGIKNVFVYLSRRPKDFPVAQVPAEAVRMTFRGCRLEPRCVRVRVGQVLHIHNRDSVSHNATNPRRFEFQNGMNQPPRNVRKFNLKNELFPFQISCAIHPWIRGWILVSDHPFAAITDKNGEFVIPNVPYGKHRFRIWHERASFLERSLEVTVDSENVDLSELSFGATKFHY